MMATMGQALPKPGLRPFLPADIPMLAAIFVAAIEGLTGDDYSEAQQEAWAAAADDEAHPHPCQEQRQDTLLRAVHRDRLTETQPHFGRRF